MSLDLELLLLRWINFILSTYNQDKVKFAIELQIKHKFMRRRNSTSKLNENVGSPIRKKVPAPKTSREAEPGFKILEMMQE